MLAFTDPTRFGRRCFLRAGSLALGGAAVGPSVFGGAPLSAGKPSTDKSVIFLFLHGGPSQFETFDPKMTAPAEVRSVTGEVATTLPGVTFGGSFPKLAALADRVTVVRSFTTGDANHDIKPVVGKDTFGANLGSAFASAAGGTDPATGLPTNVLLFPRAVVPEAQAGTMNFGKFAATGPFGAAAAPFQPDGDGELRRDMKLGIPLDRLGDRRKLLSAFDAAQAGLESESLDANRKTAFAMLLGGAADAFDLAKEDPKLVAKYDTTPLVKVDAIDKKWKNHKNYADNAQSLGKLLLLARRLCERGAGFVTVTTNFVWDMHADVNNATVKEGMSYMAPPLDHALCAFLEDVKARGLDEKILLVVCGEMGRTPKINKNGGRDHWGNLAPLLLSGGGLKTGQVIGRSSSNGGEPNSEPVRMTHLIGTVMHTLFDVGRLRVTRGVSREVLQMSEYAPIPGLHG
jgi:hypothetical protein